MDSLSTQTSPETAFVALKSIVAHAERQRQRHHERRITNRVPLCRVVKFQELDQQRNPIGNQVEALSRDVSLGGVGLIVTEKIRSQYLCLNFEYCTNDQTLYVEVVHQTQQGPFFLVGCKTLVDW